MSDALDRLDTLAKIGASLLGVQFEATRIEAGHVEDDAWTFGYCLGLLDAVARHARLDQKDEAAPMIASGFGKLVSDPDHGRALFARALARLEEPDFEAGYDVGAADLAAWAKDADAMPTGMARRRGRA